MHKHVRVTLYVLKTDLEEAVKSIYMIQNSICATDRPRRGCKSIYMIQNSVCATDRPNRDIHIQYIICMC